MARIHPVACADRSSRILSGHSGEIFAVRFDPTGQHLASGSMDRSILLWNTSADCANYGSLTGHKSAILDLQWSRDSRVIFSASADITIASWDAETGQRIRRHVGHEEVINSVVASKRGEEYLISGSDDGYVGIWDPRQKEAVDFMGTDFPVTAVAIAEAGNEIYSGGIDNDIRVWDLRKKSVAYSLLGHNDTITSLEVSPDSQYLLSNAHDSTVRTWDIRPFAPQDRSVKVYDGAPTGIEKNLLKASWSPDGKRIAAGSGDRTVVVWETSSGKLLHKLPGHKGAVNDVRFSPSGEPLSKSGPSYLGRPYLTICSQLYLPLRTATSYWVNSASEGAVVTRTTVLKQTNSANTRIKDLTDDSTMVYKLYRVEVVMDTRRCLYAMRLVDFESGRIGSRRQRRLQTQASRIGVLAKLRCSLCKGPSNDMTSTHACLAMLHSFIVVSFGMPFGYRPPQRVGSGFSKDE